MPVPSNRATRDSRIRSCPNALLKIKVDGVFGVFLDERLARLDLLAHEDGEYLVGLDSVLETNAAQGARFGVHCRLPQLVRIHLAEALEARDIDLCVRVIAAQLGGDAVALLVGERHARVLPRESLYSGGTAEYT